MKKRVAVVLFNLGGPDKGEDVRPFLFNFFMDKNILRLPFPLRLPLAALVSFRRSRREAANSYGLLGGGSPLLGNTWEQARALKSVLDAYEGFEHEVFVCMRYWDPRAAAVAAQVKNWKPERIVLLPLYPQYSTTTTRSSLQEWNRACVRVEMDIPTSLVCCYPEAKGFLSASAKKIGQAYEQALRDTQARGFKPPRLLFSAHGLPEDIIYEGDPYQAQCEQSARAIVKELSVPGLDWSICYQSRVGPKKWIGPSTEEELARAAQDGVPVIVYPHAFVSEHVETLVEIEIEYRHKAEQLGIPYFSRVPTVGADKDFIEDLASTVVSHARQSGIYPYGGSRVCPLSSRQCCMAECCVNSGASWNGQLAA
ncbi:MAG: ferrochelatase [Micavibrio aeruginosavorus]|uniref:Ferrochelatase n=1 Tax=Micavibrio aeruginosavorus TaxID=349221 RepID=A0A7T5R2P3_9BACT|nr:MAG: ferrochelatase [Micavibrio aeruginosavorus]